MPDLHGDHLDWLRRAVPSVLVCGQGMWEDTTGALDSTRTLAGLLAEKGIPHELDLWGYDVAHDWPWWRRQLAHHLPRICEREARMNRHLIGLLLGTEEDWPRAFETIMRRIGPGPRGRRRASTPSTSSGSPSSRSTCATGPATTWSSTGWRTGTTTPASG